ncbi:MAG: putative DNA binding domain-containing protein [Candidatus Magnetomorum sp.]|nr:putative DNA binding domain-containing protein [Candidatus Magnetomorum sp.]
MQSTNQNICRQPESRRLEFKEKFPKGDHVAKTVIAFANGAGGKIVFGVKDHPRQVIGLSDEEIFLLEEQIANHISDHCVPNIIPEIYIQSVEKKNVLIIDVFPGSGKPYYLRKKGKHKGTYIRVGSTNRLASIETLEELERQRRKISFDAEPVYDFNGSENDFASFIIAFQKSTGHILDMSKLYNIGLIIQEGNQSFFSRAAVLLSDADHRLSLFPFAKIECARFKGTTMDIFIDQITIDLPVYRAPEACMSFIQKNIALSSKIGEIYRQDRWEYPLEAIREAVINAIVHRDYSQMGSDIKIAIFDHQLEITSPGTLPDTLSIEELGNGRSIIRNRILAKIFKQMKLMEAWGTGIQKIYRSTQKGYPEIEVLFHEKGYSFQVQFCKKEWNNISDQVDRETMEQLPDNYRTTTGQLPDNYRTSDNFSKKIIKLLRMCAEEKSIRELMDILNMKHRETFINNYIKPLLKDNRITMTIPDTPNSPKQKYQTTLLGIECAKVDVLNS